VYGYARLPRICNKGLIVTTFSELLPGVAAGHWDINVPLFVTAERAELVAFSVPVWALYDGFLVRTGHAGHLTSYEGLARAGDALLGVITGQVQHDAARRFGVPELRINQYEHQQEAIDALLEGRIDVYASTALGNRTLVQRMGNAALSAVSHDLTAATQYVPPKARSHSPRLTWICAMNSISNCASTSGRRIIEARWSAMGSLLRRSILLLWTKIVPWSTGKLFSARVACAG